MKEINVEVKAWLRSIGKDRRWLARELGTTKGVVDSWFSSRGFPDDRLAAIRAMMEDEDNTSMVRIPFTDDLLELAHKAASIVSAEFQDYCSRAIRHEAEKDLEESQGKKPVAFDFEKKDEGKVAEGEDESTK